MDVLPADLTSRDQPDRIAISDLIMREVMRRGWSNDPDIGDWKMRYPLDDGFALSAGRRITERSTQDEIKGILEEERDFHVDPTQAAPMAWMAHEVSDYLTRHREQMDWEA